MNSFEKIESILIEEEELSLLRRTAEIKSLLDIKIPKTIENLKSSQVKQIKTQNRQKKISLETLKINEEVYIKSEKIQNKFEPLYTGPFFIYKITENGNYKLKNEKGEIIDESFPRWRLKLAKQVRIPNTCISENKEHQKNVKNEIEKIVDHKKIGRSFKYLIKWKNFPTIENEWKKATDIQEKYLINEYHNNMLNRPKRGRKKKQSFTFFNIFLYILCYLKWSDN